MAGENVTRASAFATKVTRAICASARKRARMTARATDCASAMELANATMALVGTIVRASSRWALARMTRALDLTVPLANAFAKLDGPAICARALPYAPTTAAAKDSAAAVPASVIMTGVESPTAAARRQYDRTALLPNGRESLIATLVLVCASPVGRDLAASAWPM